MHPAHAPGTPADAVVELKRVKDSMAWCSNVARALTEMPRDLKANKFMDMAVEEACSGVVMREGCTTPPPGPSRHPPLLCRLFLGVGLGCAGGGSAAHSHRRYCLHSLTAVVVSPLCVRQAVPSARW